MRQFFALLSLFLLLTVPTTTAAESNIFNVMDYGAIGDGTTDDAAAIQAAINACTQQGGGSVVLPAGHTFLASPFALASYVDLHIEANTRLLALPDEAAYTHSAFRENEGEGMMWIRGKDLQQVSITGTGTIDGNGVLFMAEEVDDSYDLKPVTTYDPRPHVLTLENVDRLVIRDVTFANSAYWTVHLVGCNDVAIDGITIRNNILIRNSDGIDIDHSKHVRIANCYIVSGDDSICLKNRREYSDYGACEDIVVMNCSMQSRSCAFKIGSENVDEIKDVLVSNCTINNSNRGIGIQNRDEGTISNITFANMIVDCHYYSDTWWGKSEPIYVTSYPRAMSNNKDGAWRFPQGVTRGACGTVSNITFDNIRCTTENGAFIGGDTQEKVHDITLRNISLTIAKTTPYEGGRYDKRPCEGSDDSKGGFVYDSAYPLYIDTASNIYVDNYRATWGEQRPDNAAEGVFQRNTKGVVIR